MSTITVPAEARTSGLMQPVDNTSGRLPVTYKRVAVYRIGWNYGRHRGTIRLILDDGDTRTYNDLGYENYSAMVDMLRHEKQVDYDDAQSFLATIPEPTGEDQSVLAAIPAHTDEDQG